MNTTALEHIRIVKNLIDQGWCQHTAARNAQGKDVVAAADDAIEFCITGATARAAANLGYSNNSKLAFRQRTHDAIANAIIDRTGLPSSTDPSTIDLSEYNDRASMTKDMILEVISEAVAEVASGFGQEALPANAY